MTDTPSGPPPGTREVPYEEPHNDDIEQMPILEVFNAASLHGLPVPERSWHVHGLIPAKTVTIISGDGGVGKSLLALQLAVSTAINLKWLGLNCAHGKVLYIGAEDERDEMHKRLADICQHHAIELKDLTKLDMVSLAGKDAVLAEATQRSGKVLPSPLFRAVRHHVLHSKPVLVVLDTLADLFAGDENVRTQAQQFVSILRGLCVEFGATVLLLAHPSLSGMASGSGMSGSTAWNNSVRSRLYLTKPSKDAADDELRVLTGLKNNYGRTGDEITMRWTDGAFVVIAADEKSAEDIARRAYARTRFLEMLAKFAAAKIEVSNRPGANYAPARFAKDPTGGDLRNDDYEVAMGELIEAKEVNVEIYGPPSRPRNRLVRGIGTPSQAAWRGVVND